MNLSCSLLLCDVVSGEVPTQGVISKKTGLLFEKRLIEKHLDLTKTCPVTNQEMQLDDLIEIKGKNHVDILVTTSYFEFFPFLYLSF